MKCSESPCGTTDGKEETEVGPKGSEETFEEKVGRELVGTRDAKTGTGERERVTGV